MKGGGHIGAKKICAAGTTPQSKPSERKGRFTALVVTEFIGEPVMSIFIITGKHKKYEADSGMGIFADLIGDKNDANCFEKNYVRSKDFQRTYL